MSIGKRKNECRMGEKMSIMGEKMSVGFFATICCERRKNQSQARVN